MRIEWTVSARLGILTASSSDLQISAWSLADGNLEWTSELPQDGVKQVEIVSSNTKLYGIAVFESSIAVYDMGSGDLVRKISLNGKVIRVLEQSKQGEIEVGLDTGTLSVVKVQISKAEVNEGVKASLSGEKWCLASTCGVIREDSVEIYEEGQFGKTHWSYGEPIQYLPKGNIIVTNSAVLAYMDKKLVKISEPKGQVFSENPLYFIQYTSNDSTLSLSFTNLSTNKVSEYSISISAHYIHPTDIWTFPSKDKLSIFISLSDFSFLSLTNGTLNWTREEALGHVQQVAFIELPGKSLHKIDDYYQALLEKDTWSEAANNLIKRFVHHINKLTGYATSHETEDPLVRDDFGFNKLLIAVTAPNKIFSIHTNYHRIVWSLQLDPAHHIEKIIQSQLEEITIIARYNTTTWVYILNSLTGQVLSSLEIPNFELLAAIELCNHEGHSHLVIVDKALNSRPVPDIRSVGTILSKKSQYIYILDESSHTITGYKLNLDMKFDKIWNMKFNSSEKIAAHSSFVSKHTVQPAIASGNGKLIFKFNDSNLFALATISLKPGSLQDTEMFLYIINGVTGRIVAKVRQDYVRGDVKLILDQNWCVAHYWNYKQSRYEFLSVELFEPETSSSAVEVLTRFFEGFYKDEYSSYLKPNPIIFTHTYTLPSGIKAIGVTQTLQGITKQDLLLVFNTNQIFALDRRLLSPRRKMEEDKSEVSEFDELNLRPYAPVVPVVHTNILNYYLHLEGIEKVATIPSSLESTSIMAAYGLDLFVMKVMPEKVIYR